MADRNEIELIRGQVEDNSGDDVRGQQFEDGITGRTLLGSLFVGFIMMPGSMYLGLVAGQALGGAAAWVTVVLFSEIARRSFQPLKRQEIYMLLYLVGGLAGASVGHQLFGGPFATLIWAQYLVQAPQLGELAKEIPHFISPPANDPAIIARTFFSTAWLVPIFLIVSGEILGRMISIGGGYALFRMTSDVERLPFPMAQVAAAGATALADAGTKEESWRWTVFSTGAVMGLIWGVVYIFIPIFTGALFSKPVMLVPIPFIDFTANTERVLPAAWSAITGDIGGVLAGFVLPFPIVVAGFTGSIISKIGLNPILYNMGMFPHWTPGTPYLQTRLSTTIDFWLSVGIGTGIGTGVIGLIAVAWAVSKQRHELKAGPTLKRTLPPGRGDWNIYLSLVIWFTGTILQVLIIRWLVPDFPMWIMVFYGLIYTPLISYVSARLIGITGVFGVDFPYLREATIIKSGYREPDIWFVPMPMYNLGGQAQWFREIELTGTKFTSVIKAELIKLAILLPAGFLFWSFFWKTSPIPSVQYPFVQKMWPIAAVEGAIWWTANRGEGQANWLFDALRWNVIIGSGIGTVIAYFIAIAIKIPVTWFYGFVGGITGEPMGSIWPFIGGMFGRFYFTKKFGQVKWRQYAPVLAAGFGCGMGLTGMTGIALALILKSVNFLPF
ncbi:MAG: hypothetical protein SNJ70_01155 [Armatimonadota bacterium]